MKEKFEPIDVRNIHNKRTSTMGRRRLLKTLAAAGLSTTTAIHLTAEDVEGAASDQVPIVYAHASADPDDPNARREAKTKYVPADWYNDLQHARNVFGNVRNQFGNRPDVISVGVQPGKRGGRNAQIEVRALPNAATGVAAELPEHVGNVPIEITESNKPKHAGCNYDRGGSDGVPGSVRAVGDADAGSGTFSPVIYTPSGGRFCTNHHLFQGQGSDLVGKPVKDANGNTVAEVKTAHCYDDFVTATPKNGYYPESLITGANPSTVGGQWAKDGLADKASNGGYLYKTGCTSGKTSGKVEGADYALYAGEGCLPRVGQVVWGQASDFTDGDSGCPGYAPDPDSSVSQQLMACVMSWYYPGLDSVGGTGAWHIKKNHGFEF